MSKETNKIVKVQHIGIDVGRGYTKCYSKFDGEELKANFKSIIGLGRKMDFSEYDNPLYIEVEDDEYFVGHLAEKEGDNPLQIMTDDKTSDDIKILICAALSQVAQSEHVKICLGVPNKMFKKSVLVAVEEKYKNQELLIKDKITGAFKKILIRDITIFREGDAALLWHANNHPGLQNGPIGMATVGFRTTELAYYDKGLKYNDKLSTTLEIGNRTSLDYVARTLKAKGIIRPLSEIDSSDLYDAEKKKAYRILSSTVDNAIESAWINLSEMAVFIAGGTALNLNVSHELIDDPQMAVSKGLWLMATKKFCA